jgi:hypothetical protein
MVILVLFDCYIALESGNLHSKTDCCERRIVLLVLFNCYIALESGNLHSKLIVVRGGVITVV